MENRRQRVENRLRYVRRLRRRFCVQRVMLITTVVF